MPRTVCFVLASVFTFIIAGCGGSGNSQRAASQSPTPSPLPSPTPVPSPSPSPTPTPASAFFYAIITEPSVPHGESAPNQVRGWGLRDGELVPVGSRDQILIPASGSEEFISVSPHNKLLYVIDVNGVSTNRLTSFTIGADGLLSPTGASFALGETFVPMVFDPSGNFLFVTSDDGLHEYRVDAETDQLMEMPGSPFPVGNWQPARGVVMHPSGRWLYVSNFNETWGFAFDASSGALSALPGNPLATGREQVINVDPLGNFLYVEDISIAGLRTYSIASDGGLQLRFDSQVPYVTSLRYSSFDQTSGTAYLSSGFDPNSAQLQLATINPGDGTMNFIPQSPLVIPEDLPSDGHMVLSPVIRQADRMAVVPSLWAIYVLRMNADGTLQMPPLTHVDATDGFWFTIAGIAATH